jgi:hypothetical protein
VNPPDTRRPYYTGDGVYMVAGETISQQRLFRPALLDE